MTSLSPMVSQKPLLPFASIVFSVALPLASAAQDQQGIDCAQVTVQACPSLFKEECGDREFRAENVDACFAAVTGTDGDQPFCADPTAVKCKPSAECTELEDPVAHHFCLAGQTSCPTSIPGLLAQYDQVLVGLEGSLARYELLTTLNLDEATSIDILCEYEIERLHALRSEAQTELSDFESSENSIGANDQCTDTMQTFIDGGAPKGFPEETWDQIARRLTDGMAQIKNARGQVQSKIDALREAPDKLRSLQVAYNLICPEVPAQTPQLAPQPSSSTGDSQ